MILSGRKGATENHGDNMKTAEHSVALVFLRGPLWAKNIQK